MTPGAAPLPQNPNRTQWDDLPEHVRERIGHLAGAPVAHAATATQGFSPGFAGLLRLEDGNSVFVKAMSASKHPHSIDLNRREAAVLSSLPPGAPAARLLWVEESQWHLMGIEAMTGGSLNPADAQHREAAWLTYSRVAAIDATSVEPGGVPLEPFEEALADLFDRWSRFFAQAEQPGAPGQAFLETLGLADWVTQHRNALLDWEAQAVAQCAGDSLVHADLRLDNMVFSAQGDATAVDWAWACAGAPWLDIASASCALSMQTGIPAQAFFRSHELSHRATAEAERAAATILAGYFVHAGTQPESPSLPGLRAFQLGQAAPALEWLRSVAQHAKSAY